MKAYTTLGDGIAALKREERPTPRPGANEVLVQMTAAALLILFGVLLTLANNMLSFSFHAYQAELFPTRIRASAVGFVYSFSRLSVVFSSLS